LDEEIVLRAGKRKIDAQLPISWQDTGSGVFTLAGASLIIAFGPGRTYTPARVARLTVLTAVAALLIDVYTY
jgi:hypothetical protein